MKIIIKIRNHFMAHAAPKQRKSLDNGRGTTCSAQNDDNHLVQMETHDDDRKIRVSELRGSDINDRESERIDKLSVWIWFSFALPIVGNYCSRRSLLSLLCDLPSLRLHRSVGRYSSGNRGERQRESDGGALKSRCHTELIPFLFILNSQSSAIVDQQEGTDLI